MGYPGDTNQPQPGDRSPWDGDPLETDLDWSRHPLSAPVSAEDSWHGTPPPQQQPWQAEQPAAPSAQPPAPGSPWQDGLAQQASWHDDQQQPPAGWQESPGGAQQQPWAEQSPQQTWTDSSAQSSWPEAPSQAQPAWQQEAPAQPSWEEQPAQPSWEEQPAQPSWHDAGSQAQPAWQQEAPQSAWPEAPSQAQPAWQEPNSQAQPAWQQEAPAQPSWDEQPAQQSWQEANSQAQASWQQESPSQAQPGWQPEENAPPVNHWPEGFTGPQRAAEAAGWTGAVSQQPPAEPWGGQQPPAYGQSEQWNGGGDDRPGLGRGRLPAGAKKKSNLPVVIGAALIGVVLVGGGAYALLSGGDDKKSDTPPIAGDTAKPGGSQKPDKAKPTPKPTPTAGLLAGKKTDPKPLTLAEVFGKKKFASGNVNYLMTTSSASTCAAGVHGAKLAASLKAGKCTQFLRATFTTSGGKLIGTIGVANLGTAAAAKNAEAVATAKDAKDSYVVALPAKGVTSKIGHGDALGTAQARGHYLIMSWVQLPTGKAIPAKARTAVSAFVQGTVLGSGLGQALHYRDQNGKPLPAGG